MFLRKKNDDIRINNDNKNQNKKKKGLVTKLDDSYINGSDSGSDNASHGEDESVDSSSSSSSKDIEMMDSKGKRRTSTNIEQNYNNNGVDDDDTDNDDDDDDDDNDDGGNNEKIYSMENVKIDEPPGVWVDRDCDQNQLKREESLRKYFLMTRPKPKWVPPVTQLLQNANSHDSEEDFLFKTTEQLVKHTNLLPTTQISYKQLPSTSIQDMLPKKTKISNINFHPKSDLLSVLSNDSTIQIFKIDGSNNAMMESISTSSSSKYTHINHLKLSRFSADGSEIYIVNGSKNFFVVDIEKRETKRIPALSGSNHEHDALQHFDQNANNHLIAFASTNGYIKIVSSKTKFAVCELKMNSFVRQVQFTPDGHHLLSVGGNGQVYIWDVRQRKPYHIHQDYGNNQTSSLSISSNCKFYATGSPSGLVNIYRMEEVLEKRSQEPKPFHTIDALVTNVDQLKFNPSDSQILAIASTEKEGAIRLVHSPTFKTFSNFPGTGFLSKRSPISMDFSPTTGYFAVAESHNVVLYRLNHYPVI